MNASAQDHLDPARPVQARFTLSVNGARETVHAAVTFQANGLQLLAPGGRVTVNDVELVPQPLQKQGFWYQGEVKRAASYVLQYSLAASGAVRTHELAERRFAPELPAAVRRGAGLSVPFAGAAPGANERLFLELSGGEGAGRWSVVLRGAVDGQRILVPASGLAQARLGQARLYVGLTRRESAAVDSLAVTQAVGAERMVDVID